MQAQLLSSVGGFATQGCIGESFDQRVASRLQTALVIEMTGPDRRMSKDLNDGTRHTN